MPSGNTITRPLIQPNEIIAEEHSMRAALRYVATHQAYAPLLEISTARPFFEPAGRCGTVRVLLNPQHLCAVQRQLIRASKAARAMQTAVIDFPTLSNYGLLRLRIEAGRVQFQWLSLDGAVKLTALTTWRFMPALRGLLRQLASPKNLESRTS